MCPSPASPSATFRPPRADTLTAAGISLLGLVGLAVVSYHNFLLFHTLAELFSISIAWGAFVIAWSARRRMPTGFVLVLGTALLCTGLVDLLHTLAYKGMGVFPGNDANLPTQLWIAGRYLKSLSFLLAVLFIRRPVHPAPLLAGYAAATSLLLALVFFGHFPDCYVEGQGLTRFKILSEYAVCALMLLGAWLFWRERSEMDPVLLRLLLASMLLTVAQELFFTFYVSVYGISNLLGHFAKIFSYGLLYLGVVRTGVAEPHRLLYRGLVESRERLVRSEARLNEAQKLAGAGSWEWRRGEDELVWSEQMYRLFGVHPANFTPSAGNLRELVGTRAWCGCLRSLVRCIRTTDICEFECPVTLPGSGVQHHFEVSCQIFRDRADRAVRIMGTLRDVTARRLHEQRRQDVDRILRHDLKSPLASLVNSLDLLNHLHAVDPEYRDLTDAMERSARHVLDLVDRSRDLYRLEDGSYAPGEGYVDLVEALEHLRLENEKLVKNKELRMLVRADPLPEGTRGHGTRGDPAILKSMLANLVLNALEAAPQGATVTADVATGSGWTTVGIHNPGAVPREVRSRFFEKYATHGKRDGTGLGTYMARLVAEAHGGDIELRTSDEDGTTVTVRLPGVSS